MTAKIVDNGTMIAFSLNQPYDGWFLGAVTSYDVKAKAYGVTFKEPLPDPPEAEVGQAPAAPPQQQQTIPNNAQRMWAPPVECLEQDVTDLLQLTELHEASLLFCLKKRYFQDIVYTNIGPIVVALNPFNYEIEWYRKETMMPKYLSEGPVIEHNLPHSWAVAHNTFWEMKENRQNQTVLISGESGAGKTEAAKIVAEYLGAVSTMNGTDAQKGAMQEVNKRILAASPILEAFGNAKTARNDNSSRFGKFASLQFDVDNFLVGCHTTKYLLEKSRIITAAPGERVYHSFYQLLQADDSKKFFAARNPIIYRSLNSGRCVAIEKVDDALVFKETQDAMKAVHISEDDQNSIWHVVAGILYLQNVEFNETEDKRGKVSGIDSSMLMTVGRVCDMWHISEEALIKELTTNTITTAVETTVSPISKSQAQDSRDSASKCVYEWLFTWLVDCINEKTVAAEDKVAHWIGLLDIFGFENFLTGNSFEQLCINLANETLQQHYNSHIFTRDLKECQEEGIDTKSVVFNDNQGCLDLLKDGIIKALDDECKKPTNGTDKNFLAIVNERFAALKAKPTPSSTSSSPDTNKSYFVQATGKAMDNCFRIRHYAGEVQYKVDGFVEKNRDNLKEGMKRVIKESKLPFLQALAPPLEDPKAPPTVKVTVGGFFVKQLNDLMKLIRSTNPHWIRCIKPHPKKMPRLFSNVSVCTQLRSAGVLNTVEVRKAGYPIRFVNRVFLQRYKILLPEGFRGTWSLSKSPEEDKKAIEAIFQALKIDHSIGQLGKTKVFLRQEAFSRLNHAKDDATVRFAALIQRAGRASTERAKLFAEYVHLHRARILEAKRQKEEALRRQREEEERRRRAEEEERDRQERMAKQQRYRAAVTIQRHVRGHLARQAFVRYYLETFRAQEESACDLDLQKFRSQFSTVDKRVKSVEDKYFQRAKITAQLTANEDLTTQLAKRRQQLSENRDKVLDKLEEQRRTLELQRERDLAADRSRKREALEDQRAKRVEAEQKAAERRRQQKAAREAAEEKLMAELQEQEQRELGQRLKLRNLQQEAEISYRAAHPKKFVPTNAAAANSSPLAFQAAKADFIKSEWWEVAREARLRDATRNDDRRMPSTTMSYSALSQTEVSPMFPPNCASPNRLADGQQQSFTLRRRADPLSTVELSLEAQYRDRILRAAVASVEAASALQNRTQQASL